jgi:amino acid adenylation domain-containing protein
LTTWNGEQTDFEDSIVRLIERSIEQYPQNVAIRNTTGGVTTYQQLGDRIIEVSSMLAHANVKSGEVAAVYLPRSESSIVVVLTLLRLGIVYMPLDLGYPADRLRELIEDSRASILIFDSDLPKPPVSSIRTLDIRGQHEETVINAPAADVHGSWPAYLLYTSGSTGRPKGVLVSQSNLANYLVWAKNYYRLNDSSCFAYFTSLSFDLTVTSLFSPLLVGGSVNIFKENPAPILLKELVDDKDVNIVKMTPSHVAILLQLELKEWANRTLILGGEQLTARMAKELLERVGDHLRIINEYGPTEVTVGCIAHEFDRGKDREGSVPIGRPIDNTRVYILNRLQRLAPIGVEGELYIGGKSVAMKYFDMPAETAVSFVNIEYEKEPVYRTGEFAKWRPDGLIEFIGRRDGQVKINGHRVELLEVELQLQSHESVQQCSVLHLEGDGIDSGLVAYVVLEKTLFNSTTDDIPSMLFSYMQSKLPLNCVPKAYILVDSFPLTVNGKLDKSALPWPTVKDYPNYEYVKPKAGLESEMAKIWAELLGLNENEISATANFFSIGGNSLVIARLISRLRKIFEKEIPIEAIFEFPTIEGLAALVREFEDGEGEKLPPISPRNEEFEVVEIEI